MTTWQKITVLLLAALIVSGTVHFVRLVQIPEGGRPNIPWVQYVHPNVGKLAASAAIGRQRKRWKRRAPF